MWVASLTRFRRKHLGFVFQPYNLIAIMTVEENLALPSSYTWGVHDWASNGHGGRPSSSAQLWWAA